MANRNSWAAAGTAGAGSTPILLANPGIFPYIDRQARNTRRTGDVACDNE